MNPLYLQTFRRHRTIFLVLIASAFASAMWLNVSAPKMYRASVGLWSDMPGESQQDTLGALPPAGQEQSLLNELLTTQYFRNSVARRGPLLGYLKSHSSEGWGPGALLGTLRGAGTLDGRVASALSQKRVTSVVQGPHVLEIKYDAPSPALAAATLKALVAEFEHQRGALRRDSLESYRDQVREATTALAQARKTIRSYLREHHAVTRSPELAALARIEREAAGRLGDVSEQLNTAATSSPEAFERTLRVVDAPKVPVGPNSGRKSLVFTAFAGLFAGVLVCVLGVVALTVGGEFVRRTEEESLSRIEEVGRSAADVRQQIRRSVQEDDLVLADELAKQRSRPG